MKKNKETPLTIQEEKDFIRKMHTEIHWRALTQIELANALWKIFFEQEGSSRERIKKITDILMPGKGMSCYYYDGEQNIAFDWNENSVRDFLIFASHMSGKTKIVKGKGHLSELEMIEQAELLMDDKKIEQKIKK